MCGMAGYIGESFNPKVTHELITELLLQAESRGIDASGFWGTQKGNGKVLYHKEPRRASEFIKKDVWKKVERFNPNMLLVHARGASSGVGLPSANKNNHPFMTSDRSIGLMHNGRIPDLEYKSLKKQYEVVSECDSEILLRIFESAKYDDDHSDFEDCQLETIDNQVKSRLTGIRDIWSHIIDGHMAVAIGERIDDDNRRLWLFRNKHRSLWLADLRKELGQIFFCSTLNMWKNAVFNSTSLQTIIKKSVKLIEMPTEEIWALRISNNEPVVVKENIMKFDVLQPEEYTYSDIKKEKIKIPINKAVTGVYTNLDDQENVKASNMIKETPYSTNQIKYKKKKEKVKETEIEERDYEDAMKEAIIEKVDAACEKMHDLLTDIEVVTANNLGEGSLTLSNCEELLDNLNTHELDLKATLKMFGN